MNWHSITPVEMCSLEKFEELTKSETTDKDVPHAAAILKNVPVYETAGILTSENKSELLNEWNWVLSDGPGVLVFRSAFSDTELLDDIMTTFTKIIERENLSAKDKGDHFAETGANGRLWNSHEKICMERTDLFIRYCANEIIAMISRAWLGPAYQITAQVNIVHPGGKAQVCHRDYHLGFLPNEQLSQFPINAYRLSASLTLQGAVAHSDMPFETGPTKFLPFSQKYDLGYLAVHQPQFQDFFEVNYI